MARSAPQLRCLCMVAAVATASLCLQGCSSGNPIDIHTSGDSRTDISNINSNSQPVDIHGDVSGCLTIEGTCAWKACSCDGFSSTGACGDCTCSVTNGVVKLVCPQARV